MTHAQASSRTRELFRGAFLVLVAEALLVPTGLLITAFLTRRLEPVGFGLFTLAASLVAWVEWALASAFSRAGIRFVGSVADWRPVGVTLVRLYLSASLGATMLFWVLASPIAGLFHESALATYLRLFALDIPVYGLAQAHRQILIGIGHYNERAVVSGARWIGRLLLIVILVTLGFSVPGAILGSIGASLIELAVARFYVRPTLRHLESLALTPFWGYAAPLLAWALTLRLYDRLDLLVLKSLGASATDAGIYGAAQTASLSLSLFSVAFAPLLLSTLSRTLRDGYLDQAKNIACNAMRAVILLGPVAALLSGAAAEVCLVAFGGMFVNAAPLIGPLALAALALIMMNVASSILTAAGKPRWTFFLVGPLVPLAFLGHLMVIPRYGALGAASVTALGAILSAVAQLAAIYRLWSAAPPPSTVARSTLLSIVAYVSAALWATPGLLLFVKLAVLALLVLAGYLLLGEFTSSEIAAARALLLRRPLAGGERRAL